MQTEIVIPQGNEWQFVEIASKLGIKKIIFLYEFEKFNSKIEEKIESLKKSSLAVDINFGIIAENKNISQSVRYAKFITAKSCDNNRALLENKKIRLVFGLEDNGKKDFMHQRASGLNHIMCELARKNNIAIGFSYGSLLKKTPQLTSQIMGRMTQNISLCKKYKVKTVIASLTSNPYELRAPYDVFSLFSMLGMDGDKIKEGMEFRV